jgi:hypothetical protein
MDKKKKRFAQIMFPILIALLVLSIMNMDSSYESLESVRADDDLIEHYEGGMIIHTENAYGRYYDFIVNNGKLHVVQIRSKNKWGKELYEPGVTRVDYLTYSEICNEYYTENNTFYFIPTRSFELKFHPSQKKASWCIMDDREVILEEGVTAYPFEYEGQNYVLYVKVENVK